MKRSPLIFVYGILAVVFCTAQAQVIRRCNRDYRVILDTSGPRMNPRPPIRQTIVTRPVNMGLVTMPYSIPRPRTISNQCKCIKTVVRQQPVYQTIVVPVVRKFIQTLVEPVTETIAYRANPRFFLPPPSMV